jgi:hypothetical protein
VRADVFRQGVFSGILVAIGNDLGHELSDHQKELTTSLTSGGAFVGALLSMSVADKVSRKLSPRGVGLEILIWVCRLVGKW